MLQPSSLQCSSCKRNPPAWPALPALQTTASSGVSGEQALAEVLHLTQDIFAAVGEEMQRAADAELRECSRCCHRWLRCWAPLPPAVLPVVASHSKHASADPVLPPCLCRPDASTSPSLPPLQSGSRSSRQRLTSCKRQRQSACNRPCSATTSSCGGMHNHLFAHPASQIDTPQHVGFCINCSKCK